MRREDLSIPQGDSDLTTPPPGYSRETLEFARIVNLSDAVFAIAMTLLILGLDVPEVGAADLRTELVRVLPKFFAFLLAFGLVANIWWQHHKLFSRLAFVDRGLVGINLTLLCAVAVVPFPTGLLGIYPMSREAVLLFIGIFGVLLALFLLAAWRAQRVGAWIRPLSDTLFRWVAGGWAISLGMAIVAVGVTFVSPTAGLAVLVLGNLPERYLSRRAPPDYEDWA
jgi:uncharacterized membrane protein